MSSCIVVTDCLVCSPRSWRVLALCGQGLCGQVDELGTRLYTLSVSHCEQTIMCRQERVSQMAMLSHYLRPNTWPQKFLPESPSPGLGQFSVFSVIGVGQQPPRPCASIQILRRATREAFPRALLCRQHTEPPRLL